MERGAFKKEVYLFWGCCCPVSSVSGVRLVCWIRSAWPRRARPVCWVPHPWRGLEQPPTLFPCAVFGVSPVWWSVPWTLLATPRVWKVSFCIVLPPVIPVSPGFTKSYSHYLATCDTVAKLTWQACFAKVSDVRAIVCCQSGVAVGCGSGSRCLVGIQ